MARRSIRAKRRVMTLQEAGQKGGRTTARRYGPEFYERIGRKGGQTVRRLIEEGKRALKRASRK